MTVYKCKNCGAPLEVAASSATAQCEYCGSTTDLQREDSRKTEISLLSIDSSDYSGKKTIAGLLGIFLGALGLHKFVLGFNTSGIIMLVLTVVTCGWAGFVMGTIGLIEGIIYLTKTPEEFKEIYIDGRKEWF